MTGMFRGNCATLLKVMPQTAVQFAVRPSAPCNIHLSPHGAQKLARTLPSLPDKPGCCDRPLHACMHAGVRHNH